MQIRDIDIKELKIYENNPRKNDNTVECLANSIKEFGFKVPIVIDKNNVIVCGHTRLKAARRLKMQSVPCIIADDLTDEQIKAFRLADNRVQELSEWDFDLLAAELGDIDSLDMADFGFEAEQAEPEEDNFDVEEALDEIQEPVSKLGQIYQLGNHRLMCGSATSHDDVQKLIRGGHVDMVFTDPPYGYSYQSNQRTKSPKFDVLKNDDKILDFFPQLKTICDGFVFICTTWKVLCEWLPLFGKYYELSNMIIWNKGGGGIGDLKHTFSTDYEILLCSNNGCELQGKRYGSVWGIKKDAANEYIHATQKPVELPAFAIKNTTKSSDIVLDLFGGSGSTLIACEQMNRKCYTMELDPKYCDVIIKRWETLTGDTAELVTE